MHWVIVILGRSLVLLDDTDQKGTRLLCSRKAEELGQRVGGCRAWRGSSFVNKATGGGTRAPAALLSPAVGSLAPQRAQTTCIDGLHQ